MPAALVVMAVMVMGVCMDVDSTGGFFYVGAYTDGSNFGKAMEGSNSSAIFGIGSA